MKRQELDIEALKIRSTFSWERVELASESAFNNLAQTRALRLGRLSDIDRRRTEPMAPPRTRRFNALICERT